MTDTDEQEDEPPPPQTTIHRQDGVNESERTLLRLSDNTFLSLWSYAGVQFAKNAPEGKLRGKELADLLVVFHNHVLIFSDRSCKFPSTGDLDLDWQRWARESLLGSSRQVFGAERWLRDRPDRLYLDARCTQKFPLVLPKPSEATYHRIVVARGSSLRCLRELGGRGSLMIVPSIIGEQHLLPRSQGGMPFAVGQLNPKRGFVHVLDDNGLILLLKTLNTVTDFVDYLTLKERLVLSGRLEMAPGEEELLGLYYRDLGPEGKNDFVLPPGEARVVLGNDFWDYFEKSPQRKAQLVADRVSFLWDRIIERFNEHAMGGTLYHASKEGLQGHEKAVRFMARESRVRRRMLAEALLGIMQKTRKGQRGARIMFPSEPGDPLYVFLLLPLSPGQSEAEYRRDRELVLQAHCIIAKLHCPEAKVIIGLATETSFENGGRSEDLLYYDAATWTPEEEEKARQLQAETGWLTNLERSEGTEYQFPPLPVPGAKVRAQKIRAKGSARNEPCPCGSGKKLKKCHGV